MEQTALNIPQIGLVMAALFILSIGYNWLLGKAVKAAENYTAVMVVGGCAYTLIGSGFAIGWTACLPGHVAVLITVGCFAASGIPMVLGSLYRNAVKQQADIEQSFKLAREFNSGTEEDK